MIKALRITSIVAAILAAGFLVFAAVYGVRSDEQIEQFLDSVGAIEKFSKTSKGDSTKAGSSQIPPLVKQAQAFALYLNPPPKPKPTRPRRGTAPARKPSAPRKPSTVSAKFKLIGTSFYALRPELSLALIDHPSKGLRWVRQDSNVGHLVIEQVKDGLVVVRDGQRTFELAVVERPKRRSLIKGSGSDGPEAGSQDFGDKAGLQSVLSARPRPTKRRSVASKATGPVSARESALMDKLIEDLRAGEHSPEQSEALMEKLIFDLEAGGSGPADATKPARQSKERISAEEAEKLDHLGKELEGTLPGANDVQLDPNQAEKPDAQTDANSPDPNSTDEK